VKSLLVPASVALLIHLLLFSLHGDWLKTQEVREPRVLAFSFSLVPTPVEKPAAPVVDPIDPFPLPEEAEKQVVPEPKPLPRAREEDKPREVLKKRPSPPPEKIEKKRPPPDTPPPAPVPEMALTPTEDPSRGTPEQETFFPPAPQRPREKGGSPSEPYAALPSSPPPEPVKEAIPVYRNNPPPEYPSIARRRGYEGTVVLEVLVDERGRVSDLEVFQSSGHEALDRAALASVRKWVFEPARRGEQKITMWVKVPIRFKLN
jgi:periplasmic protein TonB